MQIANRTGKRWVLRHFEKALNVEAEVTLHDRLVHWWLLAMMILKPVYLMWYVGSTREIGSALTRLCMRHRSIDAKLKTLARYDSWTINTTRNWNYSYTVTDVTVASFFILCSAVSEKMVQGCSCMALDLQSIIYQYNRLWVYFPPGLGCVASLGKLFTHICFCHQAV